MKHFRKILVLTAALSVLSAVSLQAQAPGVKIVEDRNEESYDRLIAKAKELRTAGKLLTYETVKEQLRRKSCELDLPKTATQKLTDRELWQRTQKAHVRVGYLYLCKSCDDWHVNVAGGYYITADGAVATCYHVLRPPDSSIREAYLFVTTEDGKVYPVTEVLAASAHGDVAVVRVKPEGAVTALALNSKVYPGDGAWCYSDPAGRSSYFSKGMVNRFFELPRPTGTTAPRIDVSTDWAPGSSGSAVVDECGNAIGHVSEIESSGRPQGRAMGTGTSPSRPQASATFIIFHYAARAADVLSLVKPPGSSTESPSEPHGGDPAGSSKS
jgi:hypothetical protein